MKIGHSVLVLTIAKATDAEDHKRLLETIHLLKGIGIDPPTRIDVKAVEKTPPESPPNPTTAPKQPQEIQQNSQDLRAEISLIEMMKKFEKMKNMAPETIKGYTETTSEFHAFLGEPASIQQITDLDVLNFREHLIQKQNRPATVDKKIMSIRSVLKFAVEEKHIKHNPAVVKNLLTNAQKQNESYEIFDQEEVILLFKDKYFKQQRTSNPHYYWCVLLVFFTGLRHGEAVGLTKSQIKKTDADTYFVDIKKGKTKASKRCVPFPAGFFNHGFATFISNLKRDDKIFKFTVGNNGLGLAFTEHLKAVGITRDKLVLHSLRKFYNDQLRQDGVSLEVRCPLLGHALRSVNIDSYSNEFTVDELAIRSANTMKRFVKMTPISGRMKSPSAEKSIAQRKAVSESVVGKKVVASKSTTSGVSTSKTSASMMSARKAKKIIVKAI